MAPLPTSVIGDGAVKILWVPTIAVQSAPTAAELTGASVVDLTCYLTGITPGTTENTVTDDRLCSKQTFEQAGTFSDTLEWTYIYQPQALTATDNKAFSTLIALSRGFVVMRWGMAFATAVAATQIVDVYPAQCGVQRKQAPARNETLKVTQTMHITDVVQRDVAVAA